jgi:hypothetical protein
MYIIRMSVTIKFVNFWETSHNVQNLFFKPLLERVTGAKVDIEKDLSKCVDIDITSVFPKNSTYKRFLNKLDFGLDKTNWEIPSPNSKISLWYTGENKRPPCSPEWDFLMSYEVDDLGGQNAYLPLWVLNLDWFDLEKSHGFTSSYNKVWELTKKRDSNPLGFKERKFCAVFMNNPVPWRIRAINELSKISKVDIYGSYSGLNILDKYEVAKDYKFVMAFENDLYPGYVSEKPLEAYQAGAVPLYWGIDKAGFINPKSIINLNDFHCLEDFILQVAKVNSDCDIWTRMVSEPFLTKEYDLDQLVERLKKVIQERI